MTTEHRWRTLAVTLVVGFMTLLDVTIVNVALPSIQRGLDASPQGIQWIVSGYALTFGLTLVAGGRLGDVLGRRRMFLLGLGAFTLTSAAAGAAPNEELIVAARLLQGVAAGMLTPQNTGLIQDLFSGEERGRAFGIFGTTVGVSAAAGPVLGGLILAAFGEEHGWRFVFLVNVPIGLVAMVLAARLIPRGRRQDGRLRSEIDWLGAVLLGLAVLGFLLPLVESMGDPSTPLWLLLPVTGVCGWLFVRWERRLIRHGRSPLLDVRLFSRTPGYRSGIALGSIYFCGFSGIWLVLALFFQDGLGYTPLQSGLAVTPFAIGSATSAVVAGRLVERWHRWLTVAGLSLVVLGFGVLAVIVPATVPHHTALVVAAPLLVAGVGAGAVISPNVTITLAEVPARMGGAAGAALQTGQRLGSAVGAAVLAAAFRLSLHDMAPGDAVAVTFGCSIAFMLVALAVALVELHGRRTGRSVWGRGPDFEEAVAG
ncbi:MAG TPA: MFS transporter, partial [Nocardioidaceae bacterium]|nr:MFS transporter [Nocardioidaceae bacterium]